jgi:hypothetical protein
MNWWGLHVVYSSLYQKGIVNKATRQRATNLWYIWRFPWRRMWSCGRRKMRGNLHAWRLPSAMKTRQRMKYVYGILPLCSVAWQEFVQEMYWHIVFEASWFITFIPPGLMIHTFCHISKLDSLTTFYGVFRTHGRQGHLLVCWLFGQSPLIWKVAHVGWCVFVSIILKGLNWADNKCGKTVVAGKVLMCCRIQENKKLKTLYLALRSAKINKQKVTCWQVFYSLYPPPKKKNKPWQLYGVPFLSPASAVCL